MSSTAPDPSTTLLTAERLLVGYRDIPVIDDLDLQIEPGAITALIGPNGSGKSTLLSALSRLIPVQGGAVLLDGKDIRRLPTRQVATRLGLLPQNPIAPEGITVAELVRRGRHPHRRFRASTVQDDQAVASALVRTGIAELAARPVDTLSGGQRQRAWIAMALAQQTPLLLLDEPTSYLDISHQIDVLDVLVDLRDQGSTIVIVIHDLDHAARYADIIVALKDGAIVGSGAPSEVMTEELIGDVFGVRARVISDPDTGRPLVLPRGRHDPPGDATSHPPLPGEPVPGEPGVRSAPRSAHLSPDRSVD